MKKMAAYTYKKILEKAKECTTNVKENYKLGINSKWSYYFAKAVITPKKDIKKIEVNDAPNPTGTKISRTASKADYMDIAKRYVKYVENDKKHRLPNYVTYGNHKIRPRLATLVFAKILVSYSKNDKYPDTVNINSKAFTKPVETGNKVYDHFVEKTGYKPKNLDDVCNWVLKYVKYLFYFDDVKSNFEVIDSKSGNCTDLLQFLINMAEALGYDWEVIHTKCKQSGTGHVYGRFKKKGTSNWFTRDIACIADESRYCIWCEVPNGGNLLAKNPNWFLANLRR